MSAFELFIVGQCMVATCLVLWFLPRSRIHVFVWLRQLGWRKGKWSTELRAMKFWTKKDWELWSAVNLPAYWSELLSCPYCLGARISFFVAFFLILATGAPWWFIVAGTFGWTGLGALILKQNEH